ncbi:hypothetical protein DPMN_073595 [Dreissena polymorpha]|uniref:Uncharacterized protein n=1 Tax=Dreissena polymorpha TaxID=45954 RepID=A0A9D4BZD2_DREPO|nr:hypothetical protein DPMN_073595 [Dreissena polymorpha]
MPEVRCVAARALGTMRSEDLKHWLLEELKSNCSADKRSGAAEGLAEVVRGMGLAELDALMYLIIGKAQRTDIPPHELDGSIMTLIYLPSVFKEEFKQYIERIIPTILKALSNYSENVYDTALRAGQRIINMYANTDIELLLPKLEFRLFDDSWRFRKSSIQLLGDLLYRISGVSDEISTASACDDDTFGTESSQQLILSALGVDQRNCVLAGLYMGCCDSAP